MLVPPVSIPGGSFPPIPSRGILCVVTGGDDLNRRFVITASFTKSLKEGSNLWTK